MATRRMKTRKRSCKNGKLKNPIKTKSGGKRRCKKSKRKSRRKGRKGRKSRRRKYRMIPNRDFSNNDQFVKSVTDEDGSYDRLTNDRTIYNLLDAGADVNQRFPPYGTTLLMFSSFEDNRNLFETLLRKYRANPNIRDVNGKTLLHHLTSQDGVEEAAMLMKYGADPNIRDNNGDTPIGLARKYNLVNFLNVLTNRPALKSTEL